MKIKQKKQVNLSKLIEWAEENGIVGEFQSTDEKTSIIFVSGGVLNLHASKGFLNKEVLFEIEEEVEINEDTVLNLVSVDYLDKIAQETYITINDIVQDFEDIGNTLKYIYLQQEDGRIGQLLWENGKMVD